MELQQQEADIGHQRTLKKLVSYPSVFTRVRELTCLSGDETNHRNKVIKWCLVCIFISIGTLFVYNRMNEVREEKANLVMINFFETFSFEQTLRFK